MKRLITIYYNVTDGQFLTADGQVLPSNERPFSYFKEKPLVNIQLVVDADMTPYTDLVSDYTFTASIDNDHDHSSTVLCFTDSDGINQPGDWFGDGDSSGAATTADDGAGEFSIRLDGNTSQLETALGTNASGTGWLEILARDASSAAVADDLVWVLKIPWIFRNIINPYGAAPDLVVGGTNGISAITNGASSVTVTGLGLASTPTVVVCIVHKPTTGDYNLFATVRYDTLTTDGFIVDLSAATNKTGYQLCYVIW